VNTTEQLDVRAECCSLNLRELIILRDSLATELDAQIFRGERHIGHKRAEVIALLDKLQLVMATRAVRDKCAASA
jgi:hypothetical protein